MGWECFDWYEQMLTVDSILFRKPCLHFTLRSGIYPVALDSHMYTNIDYMLPLIMVESWDFDRGVSHLQRHILSGM